MLASPNSEEDYGRLGYPIQHLMSLELEDSSSSTNSSLFESSDDDALLMDSPRRFSMTSAFGRSVMATKPTFSNPKFDLQEPAVLPPQLAYIQPSTGATASGQGIDAESRRQRSHGRQISDSEESLSSSPSSASSSSSSHLSSASSNTQWAYSSYSSSLESVGPTFGYPIFNGAPHPNHASSQMAYGPNFFGMGSSMSQGSNGAANMGYFGGPSHAPHGSQPYVAHPSPYYGAPAYGLYNGPAPYGGPQNMNGVYAPSGHPSYPHPSASSHMRSKSHDLSSGAYIQGQEMAFDSASESRMHAGYGSSIPTSSATAGTKSMNDLRGAKEYVPEAEKLKKLDLSKMRDSSVEVPVTGHLRSLSDRSGGFTSQAHSRDELTSSSGSERLKYSTPPLSRHSSSSDSSDLSLPSASLPDSLSSAFADLGEDCEDSFKHSKEHDEKLFATLKELGEEKGFEEAQAWALARVKEVSKGAQWKLCVELADLAKRDNVVSHARVYYQLGAQLNGSEAKAWLEWAKMEEESGKLDYCEQILAEGLKHCGANSESLVLRALRILVSRDKIQEARQLLGSILAQNEMAVRAYSFAENSAQSGNLPGNNPNTSEKIPSLASAASSTTSGVATTTNTPDVREWRMVLEGAMLEWRAGRPQLAHSILRFLQASMPSRTQPYMSRAELYKKEGRFDFALQCIISGLSHLPNAGMLWFEALQLQQQLLLRMDSSDVPSRKDSSDAATTSLPKIKTDGDVKEKLGKAPTKLAPAPPVLNDVADFSHCPSTKEAFLDNYFPKFVERSLQSLSPELIWKFHLEVAQFYEYAGDAKSARRFLGLSAHTCPQNLLWRVWLAGARMELFMGGGESLEAETKSEKTSKTDKSKKSAKAASSAVRVEQGVSFTAEQIKVSRRLLVKAAKSVPKKMQSIVWLEISRVEEYVGGVDEARYVLQKAKRETKNEWKVFLELILLEMRHGNYVEAIKETRAALAVHPSAGRLWAVLIQAHHFLHYDKFNLTKLGSKESEGFEITKKIFNEALNEVPKSGEVWCEGARLALHAGLLADARRYLSFAVELTSQYGDTTIEFLRLKLLEDIEKEKTNNISLPPKINDPSLFLSLDFNQSDRLAQLCTYADPNYGPLWSYCKNFAHDPSITTMASAHNLLLDLYQSDPSMDLARHLLGSVQQGAVSRRKLIFS